MKQTHQYSPPVLRHQDLTRYILPMREGGSLPLLGEADDGFRYVVKMRGAGHGAKALVAELIGGEISRAAGLRVPEQVFLSLDSDFGITEGDEEIQQLLRESEGLNLGLHFLEGAMPFDVSIDTPPAELASAIVWTDALLTNVDRTARNTNMLVWHSGSELWLIDHGASLYFHHSWPPADIASAAKTPFRYISEHALLPYASRIIEADSLLRDRLTPDVIDRIVSQLPDSWITPEQYAGMSAEDVRAVYRQFLNTRIANSQIFVDEAIRARRHAVKSV